MSEIERGIRRYLETVMRDHGLSATGLAKEAGIAASTLTRFLNDDKHKFTLSNSTLEKIAAATKMNPAPFLQNEDIASIGLEIHGLKEGGVNDDGSLMLTIGDVSPGVWVESRNQFDNSDNHFHWFRPSNFSASEAFACRVRGRTLDDVARDGEYLLCIRTEAYLKSGHVGDEKYVVVQTEREGDLYELTVQLAQRVEDGIILRSAHWSAAGRSFPTRLSSYDDITQNFRIIGFVSAVVRYPETHYHLRPPALKTEP